MSRIPFGQPAAVGDYDEDRDEEVSGTRVEARTGRQALVRQPHPPRTTSQASASRPRSSSVAPERLGRSMTAPFIEKARSSSRARPSESSTARSAFGAERDLRFTLPNRPAAHPLQPPQGLYGSGLPRTTVPGAIPRMRTHSYNGARPTSWTSGSYSYMQPPMPSPTAPLHSMPLPPAHGPPLSRSAYIHMDNYQQHSYPTARPNYTQPTSPMSYVPSAGYMPGPSTISTASSVYTPSLPEGPLYTPHYTAPSPAVQPPKEMYNARIPDYPSRSATIQPESSRRTLRRSTSDARSRSYRHGSMPGSFDGESVFDDSDDYECEAEQEFTTKYSRHDRPGLMGPPPRSLYRESGQPSSSYRRSVDLDTNPRIEYNPDPAPRPSDLRRHSSTRSSRSRQLSISEAASSLRTPATEVSEASRGVGIEVNGRKKYLRAEDVARLRLFAARQAQSTEQRVNAAEAYQAQVRGGETDDLTAENIRAMIDNAPSAPPSRHSQRSRRSTRSGTHTEGMRIKVGDQVVHIRGGSGSHILEIDEDGTPMLLVGQGSGRAHSYYTETSKSSGSRVGRTRAESDRDGRRRSGIPDLREI